MAHKHYLKNDQIVQILVITSCCFSTIGSGMQYAWTSPSIPKMVADERHGIGIDEASYFMVFLGFAMAVSAPLGSVMIDKVGRKNVGMLITIPQIVGWLMAAFITNVWLLYLSRFIAGVGESVYYATIPIYVCEISDPIVRQSWAIMISVALYLGIFLVNLIGAKLSVTSTALICMCFSCFHIVAFSWVPESPYYLLMKNRPNDARKSLQLLRNTKDVENELTALTKDVNRQLTESGTWRDLFFIRSNRRALLIVVGIRVLQQLSGLTAFEVYAQYMFGVAEVDLSASASAVIFSGMLLLGPLLGTFVVKRYGRKPLLLYSTLGCGFALALEAIYFILKSFTDINVAQLYWFPLCGMVAYVLFCSLGLATLPSLIAGEMFSTSIKSKATITNNVMLAICILVVPKVFQILTEAFGIFSAFLLFASSCFLGIVFVYVFVVETKGKTLEEIQQELKRAQKLNT